MSVRNHVVFYINGQRFTVSDDRIFMPLANFLRYEAERTGTKIVCAEGDCGACTVLFASPEFGADATEALSYKSCNSCIVPVYKMDGCSIITVEGVQTDRKTLDPVQQAFVDCNASQCGFCTPGFIMSSVGLYEQNANPTAENVKNELTGNLCRCTGYDAIIKAGCSVDTEGRQLLRDRYFDEGMHQELLSIQSQPVQMVFDHKNARYDAPVSLNDAVQLLQAEGARLIAGSTDLGVQINKGRHTEKRFLDLRLIESLYQCRETETELVIGARVTFAELRRHLQDHFPEYAQYMNLFASPQIRNVGTMVGNIANASPIADSTPYLLMSNARIGVIGPKGRREIPMTSFYLGYKTLAMAADELIESVTLPKPHPNDFIRVFKISARRDLDIACVNLAASIRVEEDVIVDCQLAFGGVGPVIIRTSALEDTLIGQCLPTVSSTELLPLLRSLIAPISDVRGSQQFRFTAAGNLFRKFISEAQVALTSSMVSQ